MITNQKASLRKTLSATDILPASNTLCSAFLSVHPSDTPRQHSSLFTRVILLCSNRRHCVVYQRGSITLHGTHSFIHFHVFETFPGFPWPGKFLCRTGRRNGDERGWSNNRSSLSLSLSHKNGLRSEHAASSGCWRWWS